MSVSTLIISHLRSFSTQHKHCDVCKQIFKGKMNSVVNMKLKILGGELGLETLHLILQLLDSLMKRLMSKSIVSGLLMKK